MKVAFTGTSAGLTNEQLATLGRYFRHRPPAELHHGMCVGGDASAHAMARRYGWRIVGHPGVNKRGEPGGRAPLVCDETLGEKPYLARNRDIVAGANLLLAAPKGMEEVRRSGTWATVRYARKVGVPVVIVWPDGSFSAPMEQRDYDLYG